MNDGWVIRAAGADDWRALRLLLPQAVHHGSGAHVVVAGDKADGLIYGAAAISPRLRSEPLPGPRVAVHVVPPMRRRGIARQLLQACASLAGVARAGALYAWDPVDAGSDAAAAWARLGFDQSIRVVEGRTDVRRLFDYLTPYYEQLVERQWIPSDARLVPLTDANPAQIAQLHVKYLGGTVEGVLHRIRGDALHCYHAAMSPVLIVGGEVMGFTLVERLAADVVFVHGTVVHPSLRGGWANAWLKYEGTRQCIDHGITLLVHHSYDQHTDTRKFTRQVGVVTKELVEPYRLLMPATTSGGSAAPGEPPGRSA